MTEPQKEYIITGEVRDRVLNHLQAMRLPNANLLRKWIIEGSRPYTSAEKVLDELESKRAEYEMVLKENTSCFDEFDRGLIEGKECMCIILREWIKELRQERER